MAIEGHVRVIRTKQVWPLLSASTTLGEHNPVACVCPYFILNVVGWNGPRNKSIHLLVMIRMFATIP